MIPALQIDSKLEVKAPGPASLTTNPWPARLSCFCTKGRKLARENRCAWQERLAVAHSEHPEMIGVPVHAQFELPDSLLRFRIGGVFVFIGMFELGCLTASHSCRPLCQLFQHAFFLRSDAMKRLLIILGAVLAVGVVIFIAALPAINRHTASVRCGNQMHVVLYCAALAWPDEHGGQLPLDFLSMSNELITPKLLVCPGDRLHQLATSWATFTTNNCSYEIVAPGIRKSDTNIVFLRCKVHDFVGYADDRLLDGSGRLIRPDRLW